MYNCPKGLYGFFKHVYMGIFNKMVCFCLFVCFLGLICPLSKTVHTYFIIGQQFTVRIVMRNIPGFVRRQQSSWSKNIISRKRTGRGWRIGCSDFQRRGVKQHLTQIQSRVHPFFLVYSHKKWKWYRKPLQIKRASINKYLWIRDKILVLVF